MIRILYRGHKCFPGLDGCFGMVSMPCRQTASERHVEVTVALVGEKATGTLPQRTFSVLLWRRAQYDNVESILILYFWALRHILTQL